MKREKLMELAREIAGHVVEDHRVKRMIREVVLRTLVEQEIQRTARHVQTFFESCSARGVTVRLDEKDIIKLGNSERMGQELKAVLTLYRTDIVSHLKQEQKLRTAVNGNGRH